jgi:hypothetical protein
VPAAFAGVVEPGAEDSVQVLHARREVRIADLEDQVEMGREQAIRVADPLVAVKRPAQESEIHTTELIAGEHREAADATSCDVVDAVRLLDAKQTGHGADGSGACEFDFGTVSDRHEVGTRATSGV